MRNLKLVGLFVVLGCGLGRSAVADELFRYNYVELGYAKATEDMKGFSPKIDGSDYGIFGSYAVHELVAIGVQYTKIKASFNGSYLGVPASLANTGSDLTLGISLHKLISDNTELGFDLARDHFSYDAYTITSPGSSAYIAVPSSTDNTNSFGIRARTAVVPDFRLFAGIGRTTGGSNAAITNYNVGAEYELGKDFGIGIGYGVGTSTKGGATDYARGFSIGGRYYY